HDHVGPERREDAALVEDLPRGIDTRAIGHDVDLLRHDRVTDRIWLRRGRRLPRLLRHGLLVYADDRFAGLAIEDVRPARLRHFDKALARLAIDGRIEQHHRIGRVVVPDVVMHLLEVPAVLACLRFEGDDRHGEEVVTGTHITAQIGTGIAGREVERAERRVDGRRLPDAATTAHPGIAVLGPGLAAGLAGRGYRVEGPLQLASLGFVGLEPPARAHLAAVEADDDEAVVVQRRGRDGEAVLPALGGNLPFDLACALIERGELRIG